MVLALFDEKRLWLFMSVPVSDSDLLLPPLTSKSDQVSTDVRAEGMVRSLET